MTTPLPDARRTPLPQRPQSAALDALLLARPGPGAGRGRDHGRTGRVLRRAGGGHGGGGPGHGDGDVLQLPPRAGGASTCPRCGGRPPRRPCSRHARVPSTRRCGGCSATRCVASKEVAEAAELALRAAEACTRTARPLYAAHADLPVPDEPHLALWHAATLLREHRGDGHLAVLLDAELDPVEALVSHTATGKGMAPKWALGTRGWSREDWDAAVGPAAGARTARRRGRVDRGGRGPAQGDRGADGPAGPRRRTSIWAPRAWNGSPSWRRGC